MGLPLAEDALIYFIISFMHLAATGVQE